MNSYLRICSPSAGRGDLLVTIQEADGQKESFSVPYSSVPEMLKEDIYRYYVLTGQAKITNTHFQPKFTQGEIHYGLNNLVIVYAGTLMSDKYRSAVIGSGWNFSFSTTSSAFFSEANNYKQGGIGAKEPLSLFHLILLSQVIQAKLIRLLMQQWQTT